MSISSTVKTVMPYLKTASGYVLHRLSSQGVEMNDGTTLEQKVTSLNNLISQKVDSSDVVNNCLTTESGFVLDARQGKELDDKITELNGNNYEIGSDITSDHSIWYKKYNNGLIEYWGRSNSPSSGAGGQGFVTINFPVPFRSMNDYIITASAEYASSSTVTFETSVQRHSASRAYVYTRTNTGSVTGAWVQWTAKGYWK